MSFSFLIFLLILTEMIFLLPISDNRGRRRGFPWMTASLVAINVVIHIGVTLIALTQPFPFDEAVWRLIYPYMQVPKLIAEGEGLGALSTLTSFFLHGGWSHLLGNMLFLWFFGRKVEDATGLVQFGLFYLLCGFAAGLMSAFANITFFPDTAFIPGLGASGAISGVMGAYLFLYSDEKIRTLGAFSLFGQCLIPIPIFMHLPAWVFLVYQFFKDALLGQLALEIVKFESQFSLGVGVFAHMGGMVSGLLFIFLFLHPEALVARR